MENNYKVLVITADNFSHIEEVKALNELEALDIVHAKYINTDILDIKVVK